MKNHIKNYIKIMGLAAVPFGTAQAKNYEIKVTRENKPDADYFRISVEEKRKDLKVVEIVWRHEKELPEPIRDNPSSFIRLYAEELRRKEDVFSTFISRSECEANAIEWVRYCFPEETSCFEQCREKGWSRPILGGGMWENVLSALKAGKSGLEVVKDFQTKMWDDFNQSDGGKKRYIGCFMERCCKLPYDCSYVCYEVGAYNRFFLVKAPRHLLSGSEYILVLDLYKFRGDSVCVLSDVPTVFTTIRKEEVAVCGYYCASREILDTVVRKNLCEQLLPGGFRCLLSDTVNCFIRVRSNANEIPLEHCALDCFPKKCFEVESGRITDVWLKGQRMDTDVSKYVFKNPLEIMEYVEVFEDPKLRKLIENRKEEELKSSIYKGAIHTDLLEKLEKKQANPQNEIKLEEEKKEDKKVENSEIKNEIKDGPLTDGEDDDGDPFGEG